MLHSQDEALFESILTLLKDVDEAFFHSIVSESLRPYICQEISWPRDGVEVAKRYEAWGGRPRREKL